MVLIFLMIADYLFIWCCHTSLFGKFILVQERPLSELLSFIFCLLGVLNHDLDHNNICPGIKPSWGIKISVWCSVWSTPATRKKPFPLCSRFTLMPLFVECFSVIKLRYKITLIDLKLRRCWAGKNNGKHMKTDNRNILLSVAEYLWIIF